MPLTWNELATIAEQEIGAIISKLPVALRDEARALPVTMQRCPNDQQVEDGIEPDTLGLFVGCEHGMEGAVASPLPPQIILFLENLLEYADGSEEIFHKEVRTTYLHELGHYLGLDEDDLCERGLD